MLIILGVSMLLFIGVCSTVGIRVLLLSQRTGGRLERYCGLGFTLIGLFGYPLSLASGQGVKPVGEVIFWAYVIGLFCNNAGIGFFYAFTTDVFREGKGWAFGLCWLAAMGLAVGALGSVYAMAIADPTASSLEVTRRWSQILQVVSLICFAWTATEGLLEYTKARRRVRLGLADPVVANRFLLWGVFGLSTMILCLAFAVAQWLGIAPASSLFVHVCTAVFGITSSAAVYLSFFPPRGYRAWVRGGSLQRSHPERQGVENLRQNN